MAGTAARPIQGQELIYALDIGTRSVIGMLGTVVDGRVQIRAIEKQLHPKRAMMDGQIEDIAQVAHIVRTVTDRLEETSGCKLTRACVSAAGRALRTERGHTERSLPAPQPVDQQLVAQLEAAAVSEAEKALHDMEDSGQRMLLVGYTVTRYSLDGYPLTSLLGHTGRVLEADVVATFLPGGVIDSLYAVMRRAGLEVASLTLEPIAALNAAIPPGLRLLNLCLVDIGAGTSDIAICRDGSVVGYTMATVAGDEITEALMREYLVDYQTAEQMKEGLSGGGTLQFTNILGLEQSCTVDEVEAALTPTVELLAREIAQRVLALNGSAPSAVFLAGGGSKLPTLQAKVADALDMDLRRVAIAGGHFKNTVCSDTLTLEDPEYTTPLGIAVSAGLGLISDSCQVLLNGTPAKLFRSGSLTAMELLMMNGYTYADLLGKSGKPLVLQVDGRRTVFHGEPPTPARLRINGADAQPSFVVHAGDQVEFTPAAAGADCQLTAEALRQRLGCTAIIVDGQVPQPEQPLASGAFVTQVGAALPPEPAPEPEPEPESAPEPEPEPQPAPEPEPEPEPQPAPEPEQQEEQIPVPLPPPVPACSVILNGAEITLPPKPDGAPFYVMDLLERTGIDFKNAQSPIFLRVNGTDCIFQQVLQNGDRVDIGFEQ